ncbi:nuclear transport factor 2 family protein [Lacimonas salitolerans]|uniref:Nuclear transport factor 2 family protein n=1 Tax=Lacimonas salitolerans TaxID=1323750 RepID=A0ABW4EEG8_9RHOB
MTLVERTEFLIRRVWERADAAALGQMFTSDAIIHGLEEVDMMGPAEFGAFHRMLTRQFETIRIGEVTGLEQGSLVALTFRVHAVDTVNGREVSSMAYLMARFRGDRVCEATNFLDFMTLFEQSGRLPPRTRDMCLLGNEMRLVTEARARAH